MGKEFIEVKTEFSEDKTILLSTVSSDTISDRDKYLLLREIRNDVEKRFKELITAPSGVRYNTLFRSCLNEIIEGYMGKECYKSCERYIEYEKIRGKLVRDLPFDTHVLVRDEYFILLDGIEKLGLNVPENYKEV